MMRIRLIIALVLAAIAVIVAIVILNQNRENPEPPAPPEILFRTSVFLSPGAVASIPTTIRFKVRLRSDLLPVSSAEIDLDGDRGPLADTELDVSLWKAADSEGAMSTFYFDVPWANQQSAQPVLRVHCAGGNYVTQCNVNPDSLQPWPGGQ